MKRSAELLELSREHHGALSLALAAKRAAGSADLAQITAMAQRVGTVFERELEPHFQQEENGLLPRLLQSGEKERVRRTLAEHAELRALVEQLKQPDAATLLRFSLQLTTHVRFEERELFEVAERKAEPIN